LVQKHPMSERYIRSIFKRHIWLSILMVLVVLLTFSFLRPYAQNQQGSKDKLLSKKKKLEEEIAYTKKLLEETSKTKTMSINQLNLLKGQIEKREALLDEINLEIDSIGRAIENNNEMLIKQSTNLRDLKDEYARIIYHAWKTNNSYDRLLFIFSAEDFNQAYRRLKYFQQYSEYRKKQAELIVDAQNDLSRRVQELEIQKENKTTLLADNETAKHKLDRERAEKDAMLNKLKQQEASIKKNLKSKQEEAKRLQSKIQTIIAAEIKKSSTRANKIPTSNTNIKNVLTPEEKLLSDDFIINKGKLPWPVASGVISDYFGEHDHAVLPGIKVKNNGIDISTGKGSSARAVFNGIISSIVSITDNNMAVIIRHGDYFTVYSNLKSVNVSKGAAVTTKQTIGTIFTDPDEGKTAIHFELWQGKALQNPTDWLAR
jgi:murein hydrolase activator